MFSRFRSQSQRQDPVHVRCSNWISFSGHYFPSRTAKHLAPRYLIIVLVFCFFDTNCCGFPKWLVVILFQIISLFISDYTCRVFLKTKGTPTPGLRGSSPASQQPFFSHGAPLPYRLLFVQNFHPFLMGGGSGGKGQCQPAAEVLKCDLKNRI